MSQNMFEFNKQFYKKSDGTALGNVEMKAKEQIPYFPTCWLRYVGDIFVLFTQIKV